jgi:hypothetical protein
VVELHQDDRDLVNQPLWRLTAARGLFNPKIFDDNTLIFIIILNNPAQVWLKNNRHPQAPIDSPPLDLYNPKKN